MRPHHSTAAAATVALLAVLLSLQPQAAQARRVLATVPFSVKGDMQLLSSTGAKGGKLDEGGQILTDWTLLEKGCVVTADKFC